MTEISIDEAVDISRAGLLYDRLKPLLAQGAPVTLNLNQLSSIDGAGIQLIYAFLKSARELGIDVQLGGASDVFKDAVNTVGLSEFFGFSD